MASVQPVAFGDLLRRYRTAAGLTREELAARAGLSARGIGALETGERSVPQRATLERLAEALGLSAPERVRFEAARGRWSTPAPPRLVDDVAAAARARAAPFVGRAEELAVVERLLDGAGAPLLAILGEPGIGKSRLLDQATTRAGDAGWAVLRGACHRRSGQEPYAPLIGAFARLLAVRTSAQMQLDLQGCSWLVRLLPEVAEHAVAPASSWTLPPEHERRLMFAAVARFLANVAGPAGALLVLDDLHWAGEDALALLATLLREPGARPLKVLGACRDTDVEAGDPVPVLLGDLAREGLCARMQLPPLDRDEARDLLVALLAADEMSEAGEQPGAVPAVPAVPDLEAALDRAGGLPLFLVSWAQELRAGLISVDAARGLRPWSAAESIRQRVAVLPAAAQRVLAVAAVAGRATPRTVVLAAATASAQREADTLAGMDAACRARLLAEEADGSLVFLHDLIRETILADLTGANRAALHRYVADALERLPRAEWRAVELAYHFAEGDEPERALPYALFAGDQAEAVYAHADAEQLYRTALELAHKRGDRAREAQALEGLDKTLRGQGRMEDALAALESAAALRRGLGDLDQFAWDIALTMRAHTLLGRSDVGLARIEALLAALAALADHGAPASGQDVGEPLQPALPGLSPDALEAVAARATTLLSARTAGRVYLSLSVSLQFLERYQEAIPLGERAVQHARAAGDGSMEALAQAWVGRALSAVGQVARAIGALEAARGVAEAVGEIDALFLSYGNLGDLYAWRGAFDQGARSMRSALEAAERCGMPDHIGQALCGLGELAYYTGEWDQTRAHCQRAADDLRLQSHGSVPAVVALLRGLLCLAEGQEEQANTSLDEAIRLGQRSGALWPVRAARVAPAERALLRGEAPEAHARLVDVLGQPRQSALDRCALLPLLAWAQSDLGDLGEAQATLAEGLAIATAQEQRIVVVDALRVKALLAAAGGRWREAEAALDETIALARPLPYPYAEAKALYVYGRLHQAQGEPARAGARYEQALVICDRLGERLYAEHIERALAEVHHPPHD